MTFLYLKALHIIFVVTWFAGMFYQVRLYIYNREAQDRPEPERSILSLQFALMIKRLHFAITWPSAVLTLVFGLWLLYFYPAIPLWLWLKLGFVVLLFGYQLTLQKLYSQQAAGIFAYSSMQLRLWNEVPTVLLFAVVFLVVVKTGLSLVYGLLGLALLIAVLMAAINVYKRLRK
jgi:putative membrane protein